MAGIFAVFGVVIGSFLYKYYFDGIGGTSFAVAFVAGFGGLCALVGFIADFIVRKLKRNNEFAVTAETVTINQEKKLYGFGGWLYLFAVGLVYQFLFNLKSAYDNYLVTKTDNFDIFTTIGSDSYNSLWEVTIWFEIIGASIMVAFVALIAYFCIKRSKKFKIVSIVFVSVSLLLQCIDLFLMLNIQNGYTEDLFGPSKYDGIQRAVVYAVVWIPYLLKSRRVKNTYIN